MTIIIKYDIILESNNLKKVLREGAKNMENEKESPKGEKLENFFINLGLILAMIAIGAAVAYAFLGTLPSW